MHKQHRIEDTPIPIRAGPELLAAIDAIQQQLDLQTRSAAIRLILWRGIRAFKEQIHDNP